MSGKGGVAVSTISKQIRRQCRKNLIETNEGTWFEHTSLLAVYKRQLTFAAECLRRS